MQVNVGKIGPVWGRIDLLDGKAIDEVIGPAVDVSVGALKQARVV